MVEVERRFQHHRLPLWLVEVEVQVEPKQEGNYLNYLFLYIQVV